MRGDFNTSYKPSVNQDNSHFISDINSDDGLGLPGEEHRLGSHKTHSKSNQSQEHSKNDIAELSISREPSEIINKHQESFDQRNDSINVSEKKILGQTYLDETYIGPEKSRSYIPSILNISHSNDIGQKHLEENSQKDVSQKKSIRDSVISQIKQRSKQKLENQSEKSHIHSHNSLSKNSFQEMNPDPKIAKSVNSRVQSCAEISNDKSNMSDNLFDICKSEILEKQKLEFTENLINSDITDSKSDSNYSSNQTDEKSISKTEKSQNDNFTTSQY